MQKALTVLMVVFLCFPAVAAADQQILDDLIVDGSACIGLDCVNGESFGFDTLRLKENNLRIKAQDTSTSASFPSNDWQITFNDSSNGGQNKFSIDDIDGGRTPFTLEAGAPSHSLYVDDGGRLGLGTSTPVADVHVKSGNTPTLRLEQDGSSGFSAQTWDLAGNEANFFIRDATNGSTLPFRIFPGAPSNALNIEASGDIGLGTTSPDSPLHIVTAAGGWASMVHMENNGGVAFRLNDTTNDPVDVNNTSGEFRINFADGDNQELALDADGNLTVDGSVTATAHNVPDYVFEKDYRLMPLSELARFIEKEGHLPSVPSARETEEAGGRINVTQLQMTLLEKIEELTLYTLGQEKTIAELQARLEAIESSTRADKK